MNADGKDSTRPGRRTHLQLVLLHVDAALQVAHGVDGAHERVGDRRFGLVDVVGAVVVRDQAAQAGGRDVPGEGTAVLLLVARVTGQGGGERRVVGEQQEGGGEGAEPPISCSVSGKEAFKWLKSGTGQRIWNLMVPQGALRWPQHQVAAAMQGAAATLESNEGSVS